MVLYIISLTLAQATFDMAYELGSKLSIRNVLELTPLTLAAQLARIDMFFHILNIEREIYWQIGKCCRVQYIIKYHFNCLYIPQGV